VRRSSGSSPPQCEAATHRDRSYLRARDEITESKEKNPAAGRNAGKESGVYA
jgi:hypothetical protein